jgi:hypothetical protein
MWKDVWGVKDKVEKVAVKVAVKVKMWNRECERERGKMQREATVSEEASKDKRRAYHCNRCSRPLRSELVSSWPCWLFQQNKGCYTQRMSQQKSEPAYR